MWHIDPAKQETYDTVEIHLFGHITQVYVLHALYMRLVYVAHVFGIRRTRG